MDKAVIPTTGNAPFTLAAIVIAATVAACGLEQLVNGGKGEKSTGGSDAGPDSGEGGAPAITGQSCGVDVSSGAQLCRSTSMCPSVIIDGQAFPHCGFRIKSGAAELVCACGEQICSMGPFTTCSQAAGLITSQTETQVCVQVAEGRCAQNASSSSGSTSGGSSSPTCDRTCMTECGGGAACAAICGCQ